MKNTSSIEQSTPYNKRWSALFLLCTAEFLVIMDTSIIGVALPAIKADLGYTQTGLQWIFNAYVILFGGFYYSADVCQTYSVHEKYLCGGLPY